MRAMVPTKGAFLLCHNQWCSWRGDRITSKLYNLIFIPTYNKRGAERTTINLNKKAPCGGSGTMIDETLNF